MENRDGIPQQHHGDEQAQWESTGSELRDGKFNAQQTSQDQDSDLDQPRQPLPLIEYGMHFRPYRRESAAGGRGRENRSFLFPPLRPRIAFRTYPASLAIIENNGMYSEITMPPIMMPSRPMMIGSSMASMSLVAASTSSS